MRADANLNQAIVDGCRRHNPAIDFLSANEANLEGVPDPDVLALAAPEDWQDRLHILHLSQTVC